MFPKQENTITMVSLLKYSLFFRFMPALKQRFSALTLCMVLTVTLQAQPNVDSLLNLLDQSPADTHRVLLLNKIAQKITYNNPGKALQYAQQADSLSLELDFTRGRALSLNKIGAAYWAIGDLEKGLAHFIESKNTAEQIDDLYLIARNIGNMGIIYSAAGNYESAIVYYRESLPLFKKLQNKERLAVTYNNMGKSFLELGQYDSAVHYLELAKPLAETYPNSLLSIIYLKLADVWYRQGVYDTALEYLELTIDLANKFDEKRSLAMSKQMLAAISLAKSDHEEALAFSRKAVKLANATSSQELQYATYKTYGNVLAALKQYDSAYFYQKKSSELREGLQNESNQERLNLMQYDHQRDEIGQLLREREQEKTMRQQQKAQIFLLYGLLIVTASLILVLYLSRYNKLKSNKTLHQRNKEIKAQKENIAQQAAQLQELNNTKDKILSIISHDLKSPLNSIAGSLNLLQDGLISPDEFATFVPDLSKNVNYTSSLLDNLLHWAKNQLGLGNTVNPEYINMCQMVMNKVELLKPQAAHKEITLKVEIEHFYRVYADDVMIQIVLQNLISNAIKFCRRGDSITIKANEEGEECIICVADTGMGISKEDQDKIFSNTSFTTRGTANEKGTGLGLQLCQDFVEKNHGRIWVESEPGKGSIFCFTLPVADAKPQVLQQN